MKGLCIDSSNTTTLQSNQEYFIFPNGEYSFYVSKFDRQGAHFGCFQSFRFEILEEETVLEPSKPLPKEPKMLSEPAQMDLFDFLEEPDADPEPEKLKPSGMEIIIPSDLISPLECNHGVKTKAFKKIQKQWSSYVKAIQDYHGCSWFEARDMLIDHRDQRKPTVMCR